MLTVELVPATAWCKNVRSEVSPSRWNRLKEATYRKAGYKCQVCGGVGPQHPVECHEIWSYDDINKVQKLTGLIALCPDCHRVKHIGKARVDGLADKAINHLANVNNWSRKKAHSYIKDQFAVWKERSRCQWSLDISMLDNIKEERFNPFEN